MHRLRTGKNSISRDVVHSGGPAVLNNASFVYAAIVMVVTFRWRALHDSYGSDDIGIYCLFLRLLQRFYLSILCVLPVPAGGWRCALSVNRNGQLDSAK